MMGSYVYTGTGSGIDEDAAWDYIRDGFLLCPRTVLKGRTKRLKSELPAVSVDLKNLPSYLEQTLNGVLGDMAGARRPVMFTGGFDSMLLACMAKSRGAEVTAVTVQFDEFNLRTVAGAIEAAEEAGFPHHVLPVKVVEFLSAVEILAGLTQEPLTDLDLAVVYAALKKYDHSVAGNMFISGMGSDQWFGNLALAAYHGGFAARLDWALVEEDSHQRVARNFACQMSFPFLSRPMLALSQAIPDRMKKDKKLLRALASANTFPHRGLKTEVQIPPLVRHILIKTFGRRAWPSPVTVHGRKELGDDQALRRIILGLWLEKTNIKRPSKGRA